MAKRQIKPTAEALTKFGDNWEIKPTGMGKKSTTNVNKRKMVVPVDNDNYSFYQRKLQMGHAKNPHGAISREDYEYIGKELLESVNDMRINRFLKGRFGIDVLKKEESKLPEEVEMYKKLSKSEKLPFNAHVETLIESAGTKSGTQLSHSYRKTMGKEKFNLSHSIVEGSLKILDSYREYTQSSDGVPNYEYYPWEATIQIGKYVREQLDKEEQDEENKQKQEQQQQKQEKEVEQQMQKQEQQQKMEKYEQVVKQKAAVSQAGKYFKEDTSGSSTVQNFQWENLRIIKPRLTVRTDKNKLGKVERTAYEGRFANPARWAIDRKAFRRMKPLGNSGALLVDSSGSMSLGVKHIENVMKVSPTVVMAKYQCSMIDEDKQRHTRMGNHGKLWILAEKGKRVNELELTRINYHGYNGSDLPALQWLAKQKGPRFWVTDTHVAKIYDVDPSSEEYCREREWSSQNQHPEFVEECFDFCKKHSIFIFDKMSTAVNTLKKIKERNYV